MNKWLAKDEQGFTLVELMMVIVILAILTGVAVPMVSRMQKNAWKAKLTSLADSLGSAIVVDAMMAMDDAVTGANYAGDSIVEARGLVSLPKDVDVATAADGTGATNDEAKAYLVVTAGAGEDPKAVTIMGYRKGDAADQLLPDGGMVFSWADATAE
jgi:prepilin-type N-terminal cleavage/methylation domain-containing protein